MAEAPFSTLGDDKHDLGITTFFLDISSHRNEANPEINMNNFFPAINYCWGFQFRCSLKCLYVLECILDHVRRDNPFEMTAK
jgi:hypothetical protein